MITIELDEELSSAIEKLAEHEHKPVKQLVHDVLMRFMLDYPDKTSGKMEKQRDLKAFFQPYQQDMTGFKFDREDANAR